MDNNSADQFFPRATTRAHERATSRDSPRRRSSPARMPSSAGYMVAAVIIAVGLFFALWAMLVTGGDETPWVPAGLAASVVLLVAFSAREVVMRRAWTRYLLEQDRHEREGSRGTTKSGSYKKPHSTSLLSATLRAIQKQSAEVDSTGAPAESHLELFHLCQDYLASADEVLRSSSLSAQGRLTLSAGQERARNLQKRHLLTWARDASRTLTHEAQQRARTSDKIETANRALSCLDAALKAYPDEPELNESKLAIREFIASVKVAHWVELAERSAFKGHYRRAIERYNDALFYLHRETVKEELRATGEERIKREIEILRTQQKAASEKRNGESTRNSRQ